MSTQGSSQRETNITLNIRSTSGNLNDQRFSLQDRARQVLDRAIQKIPLDRDPARPYELVLARTGATLALDESLEALGLRDRDTIDVQFAPNPQIAAGFFGAA